MEKEAVYRHLSALAADQPDLMERHENAGVSEEQARWVGKLHAVLVAGGYNSEAATVQVANGMLGMLGARAQTVARIRTSLHQALAAAELAAPTTAQGAFIPVGADFDTYQQLNKVLGPAKTDLLLVDPYMDEVVLTDFAGLAPEGVRIRLLADEKHLQSNLEPAARRWIAQYGDTRPLEVRLTSPRALHDRVVLVDGANAWIVTQSFKDIAKRTAASIQRSDGETATLKVDAYEALWADARKIA